MRRPANVFGGLVTCANAKAMDLGDAVHVNSGGRRRDERNFTAARFRRPLAVAVLLLTFAGGLPVRADIFLRPTTYITDNTNYERNASLVHDGADYWLFYMKADTGGVRGVAGYDPDSTRYTVYYRKSNTMAGLAGAPETELTESNATNGPPTLNQRNVSAAVLDGKTYAFVDSGVSGASGTKKLYYYKHDAGSWSNYEQLTGGSLSYGGHVNVCTAGDHIAIAWNGGETSDFFTFDGSTNDIGSTQVDIDGGIMPKIAKLGSDLYAVNIGKGGGWPIQLWKSDDDGQTWTGLGQVSDLAGWDPCIFAHQGELYVVNAPGVGSDGQKLVMACSLDGGATWSASEDLSTGGAGTEEWWDYWPIGFSVPAGPEFGVYALSTTETDEGGSVLSDGEIALMQIAGAVVPEPAAAVVWLLGAGVVFCCAAMRRQKKTFDKT